MKKNKNTNAKNVERERERDDKVYKRQTIRQMCVSSWICSLVILENENVSWDVIFSIMYVESLMEFIWLLRSLKCAYFFRHTSVQNSRVKRAWTGIVKRWMTYQKVIYGTMWVRLKHEKKVVVIAWSINMIFKTLKKLMHCQRNRIHGPSDRTWVAY